jgi:hypothetical protein
MIRRRGPNRSAQATRPLDETPAPSYSREDVLKTRRSWVAPRTRRSERWTGVSAPLSARSARANVPETTNVTSRGETAPRDDRMQPHRSTELDALGRLAPGCRA